MFHLNHIQNILINDLFNIYYFKSYNTESGYRVDILSCFHQSLGKVDESNRNFRLRFERNKPAYIPENI